MILTGSSGWRLGVKKIMSYELHWMKKVLVCHSFWFNLDTRFHFHSMDPYCKEAKKAERKAEVKNVSFFQKYFINMHILI